ncbi:MAG: hypothetical protein WCO65_02770 [bacterium]
MNTLTILIEALLRIASLVNLLSSIVVGWYLYDPCNFKGDQYLKKYWDKKYWWIGAVFGIVLLIFAFANNDGDCKEFFLGSAILFWYCAHEMPETMHVLLQNAKGAKLDKKYYREQPPAGKKPESWLEKVFHSLSKFATGWTSQIHERETMDTLAFFIVKAILVAFTIKIAFSILNAIVHWIAQFT